MEEKNINQNLRKKGKTLRKVAKKQNIPIVNIQVGGYFNPTDVIGIPRLKK